MSKEVALPENQNWQDHRNQLADWVLIGIDGGELFISSPLIRDDECEEEGANERFNLTVSTLDEKEQYRITLITEKVEL